jgi:lipopolysaccharide transport system permease protein
MKDLLIIEAGKGNKRYWSDVWQYRELLLFLAWRDILVRYKQTAIGIVWALLRPLATMLVFAFVFGKLGSFPSGGVPYPLLVLTALLPWQFFAIGLSEAGNSLVTNAQLVTKVYFPRVLLPMSALVVCVVDLLIASGALIALFIWYGITPGPRAFLLPVFLALVFASALSFSLWIAALSVKYRDFRYIVPFAIQLGLYVSPVGFSSSVIPDNWRVLYGLNPMVGPIDGFRWALLNEDNPYLAYSLATSIAWGLLILISGFAFFRRTERDFADVI